MKKSESMRKRMCAGGGPHEKACVHMRKNTRKSECTRKSKHTEERAGEEKKGRDETGKNRERMHERNCERE